MLHANVGLSKAKNMWLVKIILEKFGKAKSITLELGNGKNGQNERNIVSTKDNTKVSN